MAVVLFEVGGESIDGLLGVEVELVVANSVAFAADRGFGLRQSFLPQLLIAGSEIDDSVQFLSQLFHDGQADAFVRARHLSISLSTTALAKRRIRAYHCDFPGHFSSLR